jgi:hypothetical protein
MNPVSSTPALFEGQWAVAVQKKALDTARDQGEAAVKLIESSAPEKASSGSVGTRLHVVA